MLHAHLLLSYPLLDAKIETKMRLGEYLMEVELVDEGKGVGMLKKMGAGM